MSKPADLFELVRFPLEMRRVRVVRVANLTPRMKRITFQGDGLKTFQTLAPEDHVRIYFPSPETRELNLPDLSLLGRIVATVRRPVHRDYTPRAFRAATCELDIDFFIHGSGVASEWAAQATPGQEVGIGGPRGSKVLQRHFDSHWCIGDETAFPEFARRIEECQTSSACVLALGDHSASQYPFPTRPGVQVVWLDRAQIDPADPYEQALQQRGPVSPNTFVWLAGESTEIRLAYRRLVQQGYAEPHHIHASGHWKRGVANHDHHVSIVD